MNKSDLKIFKKPPTLRTERLILRRLKPSDVFDVFAYSSSEEVTKYLLWYPHKTIMETKRYLAYVKKKYKELSFYDFGIEYEGKIIGTVGFTRLDVKLGIGEIGYVISDKHHRKGFAPEAAKRLIDFGFKVLALNRIEARYLSDNIGSQRVAEKCGMKKEGVFRKAIMVKGEYRDLAVSSILREEYNRI